MSFPTTNLVVLLRTSLSPFPSLGNRQLKDFSETFPLFFPSLLATAANASPVATVVGAHAVSTIIPTTVIYSAEPEDAVTNELAVVPVTVVYSDPEPTVTTELTVTPIISIFSYKPEHGVANELADIITGSALELKTVTTELAAALPATTTTLSGPDTPIESIESDEDSTASRFNNKKLKSISTALCRSSLDTLVNSDKDTASPDSDFEKENEAWSDPEEDMVDVAAALAKFTFWADKLIRSPGSSLSPALTAIRQLSEEYLSTRRSISLSLIPLGKDIIATTKNEDNDIALDVADESDRDMVISEKVSATSEQDQMDEEPAVSSESQYPESSVQSPTGSSRSSGNNFDFIADPESDDSDDDHSNTILAKDQIPSHLPANETKGETSNITLADTLPSDSEYFGDADDEMSVCGRSTCKVKTLDLHDDADDEFSVNGDFESVKTESVVDSEELYIPSTPTKITAPQTAPTTPEKKKNFKTGYNYFKEIIADGRVKYEYLTPKQIEVLTDFKVKEKSQADNERLEQDIAHSDPFEQSEAEEEQKHPLLIDDSDLSEFEYTDFEELRTPSAHSKPTYVEPEQTDEEEGVENLPLPSPAPQKEEEDEEDLLPYHHDEEEEYDLPAHDPYNEDGRSCRVGSRCDIDTVIHLSSEADDPMSDDTTRDLGDFVNSDEEFAGDNGREKGNIDEDTEHDDIQNVDAAKSRDSPDDDIVEDIIRDEQDNTLVTANEESLARPQAIVEFSDGWKVMEKFDFGVSCGGTLVVAVTNTDQSYWLTPQGRFETLSDELASQFHDWYFSSSAEERGNFRLYHAEWDASYEHQIQKLDWWMENSDIDSYGNLYIKKNAEIESGVSHGRLKRVHNHSKWDDNFMWLPKKELCKPSLGPELKVTTPEGEEFWPEDLTFYPGESWADDDDDE
ncbi:hypothetical protein B0T22DRAFT_505092 [Podospora appendiculata]|uniref:Uncharacterized protein n=1 Tax=Podospora appendiculata TaxID=314037 RepID=A0AAE0XHB7_9PEZI|nr:hypothetical protein B0T22DRAFT_505092 [Podospora appendiculata]